MGFLFTREVHKEVARRHSSEVNKAIGVMWGGTTIFPRKNPQPSPKLKLFCSCCTACGTVLFFP